MKRRQLLMVLLLTLIVGQLSSCSNEQGQPIELAGGITKPTTGNDPQNPDDGNDGDISDDDQAPTLPEISSLKWYPHRWKKDWTKAMVSYLDESGLIDLPVQQGDLARLSCPAYKDADREERKHFWVVFMASISSQESAFNPQTRYYERALGEWSEGLFQLSVSNKKPKGGCSLINKQSILRPLPNIFCAVDIMENQITGSRRYQRAQGYLFPRQMFYWSVLTRPQSQAKVIEFFKRHLEDLPFCS